MPPSETSQLGFFTFTGPQAGNGCEPTAKAFGNNDGIINYWTEQYPFWSHLSDANLIKGQYGGDRGGTLLLTSVLVCSSPAGSPSGSYSADLFFPKAKMNGAGSTFDQNPYVLVFGNREYAPDMNMVYLKSANKNNIFWVDIMTSPRNSYEIDIKIDDGLPASGNVISGSVINPNPTIGEPVSGSPCTTANAPFQYNLQRADELICNSLLFYF